MTPVRPKRRARVAVITSKADLAAVIMRWPDVRSTGDDLADRRLRLAGRFGTVPRRIDWPAMAREVDAVYLTAAGVEDNNVLDEYAPHLWGWDVPTVLWLRPAFALARPLRVPPRADRRARRLAQQQVLSEAARAKLITVLQEVLRDPTADEPTTTQTQALLDYVQGEADAMTVLAQVLQRR
jgi:hypothetical protein